MEGLNAKLDEPLRCVEIVPVKDAITVITPRGDYVIGIAGSRRSGNLDARGPPAAFTGDLKRSFADFLYQGGAELVIVPTLSRLSGYARWDAAILTATGSPRSNFPATNFMALRQTPEPENLLLTYVELQAIGRLYDRRE